MKTAGVRGCAKQKVHGEIGMYWGGKEAVKGLVGGWEFKAADFEC